MFPNGASFTRNGDPCYISNRWIGRFFGVEGGRAKRLVGGLAAKDWLATEVMTHDEMFYELKNRGQSQGFKRRGKRISRLLLPTLPALCGKEDDEWDEWDDDEQNGNDWEDEEWDE